MTDEQRNAQIAKMLGWVKRDEKGTCWFDGNKPDSMLVYDEDEIFPRTGLPFNVSWNFLMNAITDFIENTYPYQLGEAGTTHPIRLSMVKKQDTNENHTCFMFGQQAKFVNISRDKKYCLFLSVSDFAKAFNDLTKG